MPEPTASTPRRAVLRVGDRVRVRSREDVLATLDDAGTVDALPFMPEMLEFCGRELRVSGRADKTCDTIEKTGTTRRMDATVHLVGARCDGSAHGGCQAGCLLFFKEEWLEPVGPDRTLAQPQRRSAAPPTVSVLEQQTQHSDPAGQVAYRCQATELLNASSPLSSREWSQYVRDVRTGNATLWTVVRGLAVSIFNKVQWTTSHRFPRWLRLFGGRRYPFVVGTGSGTRTPLLHLQPGELVQVRSKAEIMATLGPDGTNRGLTFDSEMVPYIGQQVRVQRKVERILDEQTGKMIKLGDCVVLEGVVCQGIYHRFCQRGITPYWREAWLRRVEEPLAGSAGESGGR